MSAPGTSRWADLFRRYFGTKGGETVNVLTDVMPVVNVCDDTAEHLALRGERLLASAPRTAAAQGAGLFSHEMVSNPPGSNRLLVVTGLDIFKAGVAGHLLTCPGLWQPAAGAFLTWTPRDSRLGTAAVVGPYTLLTGGPAVQPTAFQVLNHPGGSVYVAYEGLRYVVSPGCSFGLANSTSNEAFTFLLRGYDLPLHGGEELT